MHDPDMFSLRPGTRVTIAGRTGSGKTHLARRYLAASLYHWLIFNPKWTAGFDALGPERLERITDSTLARALKRSQYIDIRFGPEWRAEDQDDLLYYVITHYENIGICIDEAYTLHSHGYAGPGLEGLFTRGRELKQSALTLMQRPKRVSLFCLSEADAICEFQLRRLDDRKAIYEATGFAAALSEQHGHDYLYLPVDGDHPILYRAAA